MCGSRQEHFLFLYLCKKSAYHIPEKLYTGKGKGLRRKNGTTLRTLWHSKKLPSNADKSSTFRLTRCMLLCNLIWIQCSMRQSVQMSVSKIPYLLVWLTENSLRQKWTVQRLTLVSDVWKYLTYAFEHFRHLSPMTSCATLSTRFLSKTKSSSSFRKLISYPRRRQGFPCNHPRLGQWLPVRIHWVPSCPRCALGRCRLHKNMYNCC